MIDAKLTGRATRAVIIIDARVSGIANHAGNIREHTYNTHMLTLYMNIHDIAKPSTLTVGGLYE